MEKQPLPPSYDDVFKSQNPTAPMMFDGSSSHQVNAPGWNPNMNQSPQYQVHTQQPMAQPQARPQVVQHQMAPPPTQTVVIISQQIQLGENPMCMMCPHCQQQTVTKVDYVPNWVTHLTAGILCILGWCPCALIPYCTDCLKDVVHTCSKCRGYLGTYQRSSRGRY